MFASPNQSRGADEDDDVAGEEHRLLVRCTLLSVAAALADDRTEGESSRRHRVGRIPLRRPRIRGQSGRRRGRGIALRVAARPPDASHHFGHGNAEYLSALVEGAMIFVAAAAIIGSAVGRLIDPSPLTQPGIGLLLSTFAAAVNLVVGLTLQRVGRKHRSITLIADGKHLMTDVWTSAGVIVGIALVALTGWEPLDPIVALAVGVNILWTGYRLLRGSLSGLLSTALPQHEQDEINAVLDHLGARYPVEFAPLRTVESGRQRMVFVVATVPGQWTVLAAHDLADRIETDIDAALPNTQTFVHIEPDDIPSD